MAHSFSSSLFHCTFSTKERRALIGTALQERLWPYISGIARENNFTALAVGGIADHVHVLLSLPSNISLAKAIQLIKGGSSKWVHDTFPEHAGFAWQEGYGAFSIGVAQLAATKAYIASQDEHHRKRTFKEEFLAILQRHGIECDERYVWG